MAPPPEPIASSVAEATAAARSQGTAGQRVLRYLFYLVWVMAVPFGLAVGAVWVLMPGADDPTAGALRVFVKDQQIPAGIVLFTVFAMLVWRFRYDLPLSSALGVAGRRDVPQGARARFEEAAALLEEAERILRARRIDIERELTAAERDKVGSALEQLEQTMTAEGFEAKAFDAAHVKADRLVGEYLGRWRKGEVREYAESIGIAVAVALLLRAFVVEAFKIPSGSMIPTLAIGDHIFVNKFTYGPLVPWTDSRLFERMPPDRADVMVFKFPENVEQDFIKRVIAEPGDKLEAVNGRPILNGWLVPHCHVGTLRADGRAAELYVEYLNDKSYFTLFDANPDSETCKADDECRYAQHCHAGLCGRYQGPFQVAPGEVWVMGDNRDNSHDSRSWRGGLGGGVPFANIKGRAMFVWMSFAPTGGIAQDRLFVNVLGRPKLPPAADRSLDAALEKCLRERPPVSDTTPPPPR